MPGQDGAAQVVEAAATGGAAVALPMRLSIVAAVARHTGAAAAGAAHAIRPAMLADKSEALGVIEQIGKVQQWRGGHEHHQMVEENSSTDLGARRCDQRAPGTTPKPD